MSFWHRILAFNDTYFPKWRETPPIYYSNALAGEAGEVCDAIKHYVGGGTRHVEQNVALLEAAKECVDVLIYTVLLLESLGCRYERFETIFNAKIAENEQRMRERQSLE